MIFFTNYLLLPDYRIFVIGCMGLFIDCSSPSYGKQLIHVTI